MELLSAWMGFVEWIHSLIGFIIQWPVEILIFITFLWNLIQFLRGLINIINWH